jgi:16S rRNA (uracil1498-N3)-methyltransferase
MRTKWRTPRIFTDQPLSDHSRIELEPEPSHHLLQVLRLGPGATLQLFDGSGGEYAAGITAVGKKQVEVEVRELLRQEPTPSLPICLMLGISRGERMEFALQKAVELGVCELRPLFTERCQVKLSGKRLVQRLAHWRRLIVNACEQSGRCRIPALAEAESLAAALHRQRPGVSLLLDPRSTRSLRELPEPRTGVTLLVGPEGGLSEKERGLALQHDIIGIRLGPRILRTETAPLAAIAGLQTLWGDFR